MNKGPLAQIMESGRIHGYSGGDLKQKFLKTARQVLKRLADELKLEPAEYDLRTNPGGAVSGEVVLHTDRFYILVGQTMSSPFEHVLYRSCNGRKDFLGGPNHYCSAGELEATPVFISTRLNLVI